MSSLAQTYLLASKVKQKLTKEAVNPNVNLRILVCQANLLDNLMDSLQHKKALPNFPSISISSIRIDEEEIEDESLSSSSDEEDDDYDQDEEFEIGGADEFTSSTNITTTELLEDDEDESDMEDYEVNNFSTTMRITDDTDAEYEDYVSSDSSISSDEELDISEDTEDTPPSSVDDDLFISLSKLSSQGYNHKNYKLTSIENDLPLLAHCSSISSEESVDDEFVSENEVDQGHFKAHSDSEYSLLQAPLMA